MRKNERAGPPCHACSSGGFLTFIENEKKEKGLFVKGANGVVKREKDSSWGWYLPLFCRLECFLGYVTRANFGKTNLESKCLLTATKIHE